LNPRCGLGLRLDRSVVANKRYPHPSEGRAATLGAARLRIHYGLTETTVHIIDEQPSPAIGHAKGARGLRNRAFVADGFKQKHLAGTDRPMPPKINAQRQLGVSHINTQASYGRRAPLDPPRGDIFIPGLLSIAYSLSCSPT
jgi:hypothetical protein